MVNLMKNRSKKAGLPPGTLVHIGEKKTETVAITVFHYDETHCEEREVSAAEGALHIPSASTVTWINIGGLHKLDLIDAIGRQFQLHPLLVEDIVNTDQRPKLDDYQGYLYVVLKMLYPERGHEEIKVEQVSLILGPHVVLSFQENGSDVFEPVRDRIRHGKGRIRQAGADYLLYSLVDAIVDHYFVVLETLGEKVEVLQDAVIRNPKPETLQGVHVLKRELLFVRRSIWPLREVISGLQRADSSMVSETTKVYFSDVYDHTIQAIDTLETLREMVSGMLEIYLSSISQRTNAVIKVLTIIATIFMPLTFIAGVYGMNFEYMPELRWRAGYPMVLVGMAVVVAVMLLFFRKKKWI